MYGRSFGYEQVSSGLAALQTWHARGVLQPPGVTSRRRAGVRRLPRRSVANIFSYLFLGGINQRGAARASQAANLRPGCCGHDQIIKYRFHQGEEMKSKLLLHLYYYIYFSCYSSKCRVVVYCNVVYVSRGRV